MGRFALAALLRQTRPATQQLSTKLDALEYDRERQFATQSLQYGIRRARVSDKVVEDKRRDPLKIWHCHQLRFNPPSSRGGRGEGGTVQDEELGGVCGGHARSLTF